MKLTNKQISVLAQRIGRELQKELAVEKEEFLKSLPKTELKNLTEFRKHRKILEDLVHTGIVDAKSYSYSLDRMEGEIVGAILRKYNKSFREPAYYEIENSIVFESMDKKDIENIITSIKEYYKNE